MLTASRLKSQNFTHCVYLSNALKLLDTGQITCTGKNFASWNSGSIYATYASERVLLKAKDFARFPHRSICFREIFGNKHLPQYFLGIHVNYT